MPGDNTSPGGATSGSGSGSGSSSGGSGGTVRPTAAQTAHTEATTFTFSSKRSPFIHNAPPGAITFVSPSRKGDGTHRDRQHRRQPGAASTPATRSDYNSDWIPLRPLRPVTEVSLPIFSAPKSDHDTIREAGATMNTHVFAARGSAESHKSSARPPPRLSLVAQHYHATSPHPFFDTPPHLITPPPVDPFRQLGPYDGYFPPVPSKPSKSSSRHKHSSQSHLAQGSSNTPDQPESKHRTPRASSSRAPSRAQTVKPSSSSRPAPRTPSIFLTGPKPGPQPPPTSSSSKHGKSPALLHPSQSQTPTPRQFRSRTPKSQTPPESNNNTQTQQPSIAVFRDCFGVLTATENVFPTRAGSSSHRRSGSRGSENQGSGSGSIVGVGSEFQRRWTRRWLRRTMRGVGSMGSGSTSGSGSAGSGGGKRSTKSGSGTTMMRLTLTAGEQMMTKSSGSQDSLDRVRVSRSNAGSPSESMRGAQTPHGMSVDLSDVDEGEVETEDDPTPPTGPGAGVTGKEDKIEPIDGGTHVQEMMKKSETNDQPELAPAPIALA